MKITATLKNLRISPRKVRLVTDSIIGMDANTALVQLKRVVKKTSLPIEKLLSSALTNAENNFGLDRDNMFVRSVLVGEGTRLRRWLPRAQGRATLILKRSSHVKLELEERVEGKNRKSEQQMEKLRKDREAARKKMVKEESEKAEKDMNEAEMQAEKTETMPAKKIAMQKETAKKGQDSGFLKKVFQRKSV
jgi:large subunit ribosomal protein L22